MTPTTLKDTYGLTISFAAVPTLALYLDPKSVTPYGIDGGDSIDNTTMTNTKYKTKSPGTLIELTDGSFTAAYDPGQLALIYGAVNVNTLITFTYADSTSEAVYGYLKSFTPNEHAASTDATAECVIVASMTNAAGAETAPA